MRYSTYRAVDSRKKLILAASSTNSHTLYKDLQSDSTMAFNISSFSTVLPNSYIAESFNMLLARCRALEAHITRLNELADDARREIGRLNFELQESQQEVASLKVDLEGAEGYSKVKREEQKILKSRIALLEKDRELKDPLFKVGVSIRARYLEMSKKLTLSLPRSGLDKECIEAGNAAAHDAMGEVDAILFQGDILSAEVKNNLEISFTELYKSGPGDYGSLSKRMAQVIDCAATIRTLNVLNEGNRPIAQRQQALDQINILYNKYDKLSKERFDTDEDVKWRLDRLITLTREIVQEDRQNVNENQTGGRRHKCRHSIFITYICLGV